MTWRLLRRGRKERVFDACVDRILIIFIPKEKRCNETKSFKFSAYLREFEFPFYKQFLYGFHFDGERAQPHGEVGVRISTRSGWTVDGL